MTNIRKNQLGSGAVVTLLLVVIIAIIAAGGWAVYKHNHKTPTTITTSTKSITTAVNPYAGWKTFCDATYRYCFKYPVSNWTIDTSSTTQTTLLNNNKSIEIDYINPYPHDNAPTSFTTVSINNLSDSSSGLKIVGGLYSDVTPEYNIIDSTLLSTYPLTVGKASQFPGAPRFTDKYASDSHSGTFSVKSTTSNAEGATWFDQSDVKTSLLVLKSFYYQ